jgi:drug/metabolite transporter (DMT)-like permease
MNAARAHEHRTSRVVLAFLAVYVIWGSTYLAIRIAIESLPPLLMAGVRFIVAGGILYLWARARGVPAPRRVQWRSAAVIGGFLLLGGNGGVVWAEQRVPSGLTALLIAAVPLWMSLLAWLRGMAGRPTGRIGAGLLLGMLGVGLLVGLRTPEGTGNVDPTGAVVLVLASLSWAWGSLSSRRADLPSSPFLATAMEMLCGGVLLLLAGLARGEAAGLDLGAITPRSVLALVYLLVFGAIVAFTAYIYLLGATTPARVSTYAFVNPVVAVFLGWLVAGEPLSARTLVAAAVILTGVVLIVTASPRPVAQRGASPAHAGGAAGNALLEPDAALVARARVPRR